MTLTLNDFLQSEGSLLLLFCMLMTDVSRVSQLLALQTACNKM